MMAGPIEEGAQTARGLIDALKDQPLSLALVVMNFCLLGFLYYNGLAAHQERGRELELLYENRKYVGDMLASCVHIKDLDRFLEKK